MYFFK